MLREEIQNLAEAPGISTQPGEVLGFDGLKLAVEAERPGSNMAWLLDRENPREVIEIWMESDAAQ